VKGFRWEFLAQITIASNFTPEKNPRHIKVFAAVVVMARFCYLKRGVVSLLCLILVKLLQYLLFRHLGNVLLWVAILCDIPAAIAFEAFCIFFGKHVHVYSICNEIYNSY
jgi:hypothetical protein